MFLTGRDNEIYCNFAGRAVDLSFHGRKSRRDADIVRKNFVTSSPCKRVVITANNHLNAEFDYIEQEQKTIDDLRNHVTAEVSAMVNSVTTIKKLIDIWPECKELLPPDEQVQSTALVANVDNLNTMIGLPSNE